MFQTLLHSTEVRILINTLTVTPGISFMHSYSFIPANTAIINPCPLSMTGSPFTEEEAKTEVRFRPFLILLALLNIHSKDGNLTRKLILSKSSVHLCEIWP